MNRRRILRAIVAILAIVAGPAIDCRAGGGMVVDSPPDNAVVDNEAIAIALTVDRQAFDRIRVVTGDREPIEKQLEPGAGTVCFGLTLGRGLNRIELLGLKQGKIVERRGLNVFFRSDLFPQFREPPAGFRRSFFHSSDREKGCAGCHDMEPSLSSLRPENPEKSTCYLCHVAKYSRHPVVHNPAARGNCFTCHDVLEGERKYTVPKPDETVCYPCHSAEIRRWKGKKVMHGPTAVGHCTLCHNPHGSHWPGLLRMQATDLCINCHVDKASGTHVIAGVHGQGHPVRGPRDPFRPEREFTCAGCHNPHAGDTRNLLNHNNSEASAYCIHCHKF